MRGKEDSGGLTSGRELTIDSEYGQQKQDALDQSDKIKLGKGPVIVAFDAFTQVSTILFTLLQMYFISNQLG